MEELNFVEIEEIETEEPVEVMDIVEGDSEESGIGAGMVALITAGAVAAGAAAVHWGKKLWAKHKAKKELRRPDENNPVEPSDDEIKKVVTEDTEK